MKTFHVELNNLGPVLSAVFDAAHFNVLCGKNNSGKSVCMHTAFCFFREWRDQIHLQAKPLLVESLVNGQCASFSIDDYWPLVNAAISKTMPAFSKGVKGFLNKTSPSFDKCSVSIAFSDEYLKSCALNARINAVLNMSSKLKMQMQKEARSSEVAVRIVNQGSETFPNHGQINEALNRMLDFVFVERLLPSPVLMTAERSGSILYGDDLRSLSFFNSQRVNDKVVFSIDDDKNHYAAPYVRELKNIWNLEQGGGRVRGDESSSQNEVRDQLRRAFSEFVAGGSFRQDEGRIYFKEAGAADEFRLNEVSTSARALAQLYYFIDHLFDGNQLLMVDEPELNLHPERQRAFVRLLARMANQAGVGIMITTHSDCIIRELNTLIAMGANPSLFKDVMKRHGYSAEELLPDGFAACGVVENGTIRQMPLSRGQGLAIRSFDDTIDKINAVQDDIVSTWRDSQDEGGDGQLER